ncbi:hypothetical protein GTO89_16125 [Heliobacterium gestii]|uniref:Uncharacterized protein n=1 Tax=Heliomicrobium gestii TaxID=2699 RepID=A0A845LHR9_HELGE|nr:hypothetical protein [Heliomicrobium gestii]MBM7868386.1 hypothetical protein [Heliomicrobium gestii]MZP44560.1 hypothetical protein [Heliomicrobium gestii]
MGLPLIDEHHQELRSIAGEVAHICASEEFLALKSELELLYRLAGAEEPARLAFQDALYALLNDKSDGS